jgi:hypothetical protein
MVPTMAEPRGSSTGVYPRTFASIVHRATLFDVAENERVVAVVRLVGTAEPNEPGAGDPNEPEPFRLNEPGGGDPNHPEPNRFGPNEPGGGGDPNEPENYDGIGPMLDGADRG